jgi:putative ABC transport system permease protein
MPEWLTSLRLRLRALIRRHQLEQDLQDEMAFHLAMREEKQRQAGVPADQARVRARRQFGNVGALKNRTRDVWIWPRLQDAGQDVRFAVRMLCRARGSTLLAVLCLGLGIGANTAIFSVVNALLLRPLPVAESDRLIRISRGQETALSISLLRAVGSGTRSLRAVAATLSMESDLAIDGESQFIGAEFASGNYGDVFGVRPSLGRWFVDDREPVAVISDAIWERHFSRRPDVLGRVIQSGTDSYTIVGVAPREFTGVRAPLRTDLWAPIETRFRPTTEAEERRLARMLMFFGHLRPGATAREATTELNALAIGMRGRSGSAPEASAPLVADAAGTLPTPGSRRLAQTLSALMGAIVAVVLMIACVNVGHLLLARGALRQREFAVRRALGASRARLLRQLLTEALVLAVGGTLCGVVLALWAGNLLERSVPAAAGIFAIQLDLSLDWRALVFATGICAMTTVLCGLLPAWRVSGMSRMVVVQASVGASARRRPVGLVTQVVMSLVLLFIGASFIAELLRLHATYPGFGVAGRLYAYTFLPSPPFAPDARWELYAQALDRLRALPGVRLAALTSSLPLIPAGSDCASLSTDSPLRVTSSAVDPAYFETLGIERVAGRSFAASDRTADTAVVTESLARRLWPERSAVGERFMIGCDNPQPAFVIGVVRDSSIRAVGEPAQPHLYRRFTARDAGALVAVLLDTTTDPARLTETVRRTLLELAPGIRVYTVQPLGVHVARSFGQLQWITSILIGLGVLALLLAAVGLYGAIAYRVSLRTREIGLRMALGATRRNVFRGVVGNALAIVVVGVAIGEFLTTVLTGIVASVRENIGPTPLSTHVIVGLIWIAIGVTASYVPAARAARLDPSVALREE